MASALAVSACGKESDGHGGGMVMPYGAPITVTPDASPSMPEPRASATNPEAPRDAGASPMPLAPAYGGPPPQSSGKK